MKPILVFSQISTPDTLQQGGCCCHSLLHPILTVNGLEELWNAVVLINDYNTHLREYCGEEEFRDRQRSKRIPKIGRDVT